MFNIIMLSYFIFTGALSSPDNYELSDVALPYTQSTGCMINVGCSFTKFRASSRTCYIMLKRFCKYLLYYCYIWQILHRKPQAASTQAV